MLSEWLALFKVLQNLSFVIVDMENLIFVVTFTVAIRLLSWVLFKYNRQPANNLISLCFPNICSITP